MSAMQTLVQIALPTVLATAALAFVFSGRPVGFSLAVITLAMIGLLAVFVLARVVPGYFWPLVVGAFVAAIGIDAGSKRLAYKVGRRSREKGQVGVETEGRRYPG